jgi:hypothetical protein
MYFPLVPEDTYQARGCLLMALLRIREICDAISWTLPDEVLELMGRMNNRAAPHGGCMTEEDVAVVEEFVRTKVGPALPRGVLGNLNQSLLAEAVLLVNRVGYYAHLARELPPPTPRQPEPVGMTCP